MKKLLLQLTDKSIKSLGGFVIVALTIVGIFVSASPIINSVNTGNAETAKLSGQKTQIISSISRYSELKKYNTELDRTSDYLLNKFPEAANVPTLIDDISTAAANAGMGAQAISNISVGTPTQIVEPLGEAGDAVCGTVTPGDFARIIPDLKNSTAEKRVYILCAEESIKNLTGNVLYNAATNNAARSCRFSPDSQSGTKFYITVTNCTAGGALLPALKASSVNIESKGGRFPAKPVLADVSGQVAQMQVSISVGGGVSVGVIAKFINNLYGIDRAFTVSSVKYGITSEGTSGTVITGFVYSHTRVLTAEDLASTSNSTSTEGNN